MTQNFQHADALNALDIYGADFERWPDQNLAHYVQTQPALQEAIRQAALLDAQISSADITASDDALPSDLLKTRILQAARSQAQDSAQAVSSLYSVNKLMRIAAIFLVGAFVSGAVWMNSTTPDIDPFLTAEAEIDLETEVWRTAATDMAMIDIFLWVEDEEI